MAEAPAGLEIRGDRSPPGISPATRGRGLFAKKSFEPGEQISLFDKPLAVLPASRDATTMCNYCLDGRRKPVKLCTGCQAVAYCSTTCQRAHWSRCHKLECKHMRAALESAAKNALAGGAPATLQIPMPVRALMLLIARFEKDASGQGARRQIEHLESNTVAFVRNPALWSDFKLQAVAACQLTGIDSDDKIKMAIEIMCRIHTNSFDRSDHDTAASGMYLDATLAMANHSCMPNAVVAFAGQKAYLRAEQPIAPGDEITISYVDYTKPLASRQHGFTLYNFVCSCPRCAEDLDVYQVCKRLAASPKTRPVVEMNDRLTLVPDVEILRNPPVLSSAAPPAPTPKQVQAIYEECDIESNPDPVDRFAFMRMLWAACQPLVKAERWAVEPLATLIRHAMVYCTEIDNYAHTLAFACFAAQHIDPYKYPPPFTQWRVKSLLVVGKTLPHIIQLVYPNPEVDGGKARREALGMESGGDPRKKVHPGVFEALPNLADGGLYEALMLMVLEQGPKGHSAEWAPLYAAKLMLDDVRESSPEHQHVTIAQWFADPKEPERKAFFDGRFMSAVNTLSSHAIEILTDLMK